MWLGIGDSDDNFIPMLYTNEEVRQLDDTTLPNLTSQQHFDDLAYIDKFGQPSDSKTAPKVMEQYYGKITGELVAQEFPHQMHTGDVHAAVYDWANK